MRTASKQTGAITTKLSEGVTVAIGVISIFSITVAYLDSKYVEAAELENVNSSITLMLQSMHQDRIERTEDRISDTERRIRIIELIPAEERSDWDKTDLMDSKDERERLLRKLERLEAGQ